MKLRTVSGVLTGLSAALLAGCAAGGPAAAPAPSPTTATPASDPAASDAEARYQRFARRALDLHYAANPVRSTSLGLHQFDTRMPDLSQRGLGRRAGELTELLAAMERIDREQLRGDSYWDYQVLDYALRAELLELEEVRSWRKNPSFYNGAIAGGLASLSSREFAPVEQRMESLVARMGQIPAVTAAARANLVPAEVPQLWAADAVRNTRGTVSFLRLDLPRALAAQGMGGVSPAVRARFDSAHAAAIREVGAYADWIEREVVPVARGEFRLGRNVFERKLRYEEHVELDAERLRDINEAAILRYHAWVAREAAKIDRTRAPAAIMDSITRVHPTPERLIPTARAQLDTIRRFIVERGIVTLPSDRMPTVRETPEYARQGFASMDTPGPFERVATEAFYNITNVDPAWTAEQKAQHLTYFNYPGLLGITVHEAMPGHFVQLLYEARIPTEVRKVFNSASVVEGWAHYTEQMMVDEGLGGGDVGVRLGQLRRALQRHARWHAGLSMHAFGDSVENAAKRFEQIAFFAPFPALRETQRGTNDPTYLYYALGRMQILKLREDYRRYVESQGRTFSLRDFHDRFLMIGLPVSLARKVMIPGDTAPSL
ncbi:MAG TPA: DUF885 domain-containing protein [Longimicrobium sp.]|nr:DUF885 domain-containing protein [Longimicrobium sp.]